MFRHTFSCSGTLFQVQAHFLKFRDIIIFVQMYHHMTLTICACFCQYASMFTGILWEVNSCYSHIPLFSECLHSPSKSSLTTPNHIWHLDQPRTLRHMSDVFFLTRNPYRTVPQSLSTSLRLTGTYFLVYAHYLTTLYTTDTYLHLFPMGFALHTSYYMYTQTLIPSVPSDPHGIS